MESISVIVPIYYGEKYIKDVIGQIEMCMLRSEQKDDIQLLFINDAPDAPLSLDWTSELVEVKIVNSDENAGIHGARVRGLKECRGEYVLFLDQDDRVQPEYFDSQLRILGDSDAVVCKAIEAGRPFYIGNYNLHEMITKDFILKRWNPIISPGQVLLRKESIPEIWIENILQNNGADDWFLWLCMMAAGKSFSLNSKILFEHVIQGSNASENILEMVRSEQEVLQIICKNNIFADEELRWLLDSYFKKNIVRTQRLYSSKLKLDILDRWVKLKQKNMSIEKEMMQSGYRTAAIYGCGTLGEYLYEEIKDVIDVKYFIDKNAKNIQKNMEIYSLEDDLTEVDCIIVTLAGKTEVVVNEIKKKLRGKVIVLKEWLAFAEFSASKIAGGGYGE